MTVGIIGLGMIGGSLAEDYAKAGHKVLAFDRSPEVLDAARLLDIPVEQLSCLPEDDHMAGAETRVFLLRADGSTGSSGRGSAR